MDLHRGTVQKVDRRIEDHLVADLTAHLDLGAEIACDDDDSVRTAMSSLVRYGFPRGAEAAGAVGFFGKPVDGQMIIGCLDAAPEHA